MDVIPVIRKIYSYICQNPLATTNDISAHMGKPRSYFSNKVVKEGIAFAVLRDLSPQHLAIKEKPFLEMRQKNKITAPKYLASFPMEDLNIFLESDTGNRMISRVISESYASKKKIIDTYMKRKKRGERFYKKQETTFPVFTEVNPFAPPLQNVPTTPLEASENTEEITQCFSTKHKQKPIEYISDARPLEKNAKSFSVVVEAKIDERKIALFYHLIDTIMKEKGAELLSSRISVFEDYE